MAYLFTRRSGLATLAILLGLTAVAAPMAAQDSSPPKFFVEGLAGAAVPTFDIAKTAKTGSVFGGTLGLQLNPKWALMGEFDYGMHKDTATGLVDIKTLHYIGKVGDMLTAWVWPITAGIRIRH